MKMRSAVIVLALALCTSGCLATVYQPGDGEAPSVVRVPKHIRAAGSALAPSDPDEAFRVLMFRCMAAEQQQDRLLSRYLNMRWSLYALNVGASATSATLVGINDPTVVRIEADGSTVGSSASSRDLKTASLIAGGVALLSSTATGFVGFERRIDSTRRTLQRTRASMDSARSLWVTTQPADLMARRNILLDLAKDCSTPPVFEDVPAEDG